jgi:hypothetical protein
MGSPSSQGRVNIHRHKQSFLPVIFLPVKPNSSEIFTLWKDSAPQYWPVPGFWRPVRQGEGFM